MPVSCHAAIVLAAQKRPKVAVSSRNREYGVGFNAASVGPFRHLHVAAVAPHWRPRVAHDPVGRRVIAVPDDGNSVIQASPRRFLSSCATQRVVVNSVAVGEQIARQLDRSNNTSVFSHSSSHGGCVPRLDVHHIFQRKQRCRLVFKGRAILASDTGVSVVVVKNNPFRDNVAHARLWPPPPTPFAVNQRRFVAFLNRDAIEELLHRKVAHGRRPVGKVEVDFRRSKRGVSPAAPTRRLVSHVSRKRSIVDTLRRFLVAVQHESAEGPALGRLSRPRHYAILAVPFRSGKSGVVAKEGGRGQERRETAFVTGQGGRRDHRQPRDHTRIIETCGGDIEGAFGRGSSVHERENAPPGIVISVRIRYGDGHQRGFV
mmetsp:Transcript_29331/g.60005  ORF Transcript_29331/g.60005 Transcript_29331/m.60005 type:complete len:373 (-) Transcript_29331:473-1591(-)